MTTPPSPTFAAPPFPPRPRTWFERNWKWLVPLLVVGRPGLLQCVCRRTFLRDRVGVSCFLSISIGCQARHRIAGGRGETWDASARRLVHFGQHEFQRIRKETPASAFPSLVRTEKGDIIVAGKKHAQSLDFRHARGGCDGPRGAHSAAPARAVAAVSSQPDRKFNVAVAHRRHGARSIVPANAQSEAHRRVIRRPRKYCSPIPTPTPRARDIRPPVTNISSARPRPINRGNRCVPPQPVMIPSVTPECANTASSAAIRARQASAKSRPPPMQ